VRRHLMMGRRGRGVHGAMGMMTGLVRSCGSAAIGCAGRADGLANRCSRRGPCQGQGHGEANAEAYPCSHVASILRFRERGEEGRQSGQVDFASFVSSRVAKPIASIPWIRIAGVSRLSSEGAS